MNTAPSRLVLTVLAALVVVAAAFVCVLYALTPGDQRVDLLGKLAPFLGGAVLGLPAVVGALTGRQNSQQLNELRQTTERVERQTNGELTERLNTIVAHHLDSRGLTVPEQRRRKTDLQIIPASSSAPALVAPVSGDGSRWWDTPTPAPVTADSAEQPASTDGADTEEPG